MSMDVVEFVVPIAGVFSHEGCSVTRTPNVDISGLSPKCFTSASISLISKPATITKKRPLYRLTEPLTGWIYLGYCIAVLLIF